MVMEGYKQTEWGEIPEDWEIHSLAELTSFTNGKAHENDISETGKYVVVNSKFISSDSAVRKFSEKCFCPTYKGNILMVMSDVPNGKAIAKCFYVDANDTYTVNQRICVLRIKTASERLVFYLLNRNKYYLQFDDGVKQTNLRKEDVLSCPLSLPSSSIEQQAIAKALSDVDGLIDGLTKLIAKKQDIKTGTMQQLLTGKTRLPGFGEGKGYKQTELGVIPEDWKVISLSQTAKRITRGASPRPIDSPVWFDSRSLVGWVRISDVTRSGRYLRETKQRLSEEGIRRSRSISSGSLIMSICATVGRPIETRIDTCIHDGFVVFDQPSINQSYLYNVLVALEPTWSKHGQTGSQMNLNTRLINSCLIPLPPTVKEQQAIAEVLSDMDKELDYLQTRLDKTKSIKQGMMQELLTGKTRLI